MVEREVIVLDLIIVETLKGLIRCVTGSSLANQHDEGGIAKVPGRDYYINSVDDTHVIVYDITQYCSLYLFFFYLSIAG